MARSARKCTSKACEFERENHDLLQKSLGPRGFTVREQVAHQSGRVDHLAMKARVCIVADSTLQKTLRTAKIDQAARDRDAFGCREAIVLLPATSKVPPATARRARARKVKIVPVRRGPFADLFAGRSR